MALWNKLRSLFLLISCSCSFCLCLCFSHRHTQILRAESCFILENRCLLASLTPHFHCFFCVFLYFPFWKTLSLLTVCAIFSNNCSLNMDVTCFTHALDSILPTFVFKLTSHCFSCVVYFISVSKSIVNGLLLVTFGHFQLCPVEVCGQQCCPLWRPGEVIKLTAVFWDITCG